MWFAAEYCARSETAPQGAFALSSRGEVLQADVPRAVGDFMALWPEILAHYEAQLEASRVAYLARQRELEEARKPAWIKALALLRAPGEEAACPDLAETVVLPEAWATLLPKSSWGISDLSRPARQLTRDQG